MEKKTRKQSIAEASIEDLVNSSLDLAAESINADTPPEVNEADTPIAAEELNEFNSPKDSKIEAVTQIKAREEQESSQIDEPETTEPLNTDDVTPEIPEPESIPTETSSPKSSIESLEIEASELESEILIEMDKLVAKADHLKDNIQSKLKEVCNENEQLQQEVEVLKEKLSAAEDKIQSLSDDQLRQQATLKKIIMILKGVNAKIAHL